MNDEAKPFDPLAGVKLAEVNPLVLDVLKLAERVEATEWEERVEAVIALVATVRAWKRDGKHFFRERTDKLRGVCMYCGVVFRDGPLPASHGICPEAERSEDCRRIEEAILSGRAGKCGRCGHAGRILAGPEGARRWVPCPECGGGYEILWDSEGVARNTEAMVAVMSKEDGEPIARFDGVAEVPVVVDVCNQCNEECVGQCDGEAPPAASVRGETGQVCQCGGCPFGTEEHPTIGLAWHEGEGCPLRKAIRERDEEKARATRYQSAVYDILNILDGGGRNVCRGEGLIVGEVAQAVKALKVQAEEAEARGAELLRERDEARLEYVHLHDATVMSGRSHLIPKPCVVAGPMLPDPPRSPWTCERCGSVHGPKSECPTGTAGG